MIHKELIIELGTEELPNSFLISVNNNLKNLLQDYLHQYKLHYNKIECYSTPRRILIFVSHLNENQKDEIMDKQGPPFHLFYNNNQLTETGIKFLNSHNVTEKDIILKETKKGKYIFIRQIIKGLKTEVILPELIPKLITNIHAYKSMDWDSSNLKFIRPIRWLVVLYHNKNIKVQVGNIRSSPYSYGHKYLTRNRKLLFKNIQQTKTLLKNNYIVFSFEERKKIILNQIKKILKNKYIIEKSEDLLTEVTNLVEYPFVQLCHFSDDYLKLPKEFISTSIQHHQRAFPVYHNQKITNKFIIILNNKPNQNTKNGNERVLKARLNDTQFFFHEDTQNKNLNSYIEKLKTILFLNNLGSLFDKTIRIQTLSDFIIKKINIPTEVIHSINRCAQIYKFDLATSIVYEFPELQGIAGMIYAQIFQENNNVSYGIFEHYLPRKANDKLPKTWSGIIIGILDKIDNILGTFIKGYIPTGSEDPYQVRRYSLSIIQIILKHSLTLDLKELLGQNFNLYAQQKLIPSTLNKDEIIHALLFYIKNRYKTILSELHYPYDEIESIINLDSNDIFDLKMRISELHLFRKEKKFKDLLITLKRIANILKGNSQEYHFNPELLQQKEEHDLYQVYMHTTEIFNQAIQQKNYKEAFNLLSHYKDAVNIFFDKVLVMAKDPAIKNNRLSLLYLLIHDFNKLLDFSKITEKTD